MNEEQFDVGDPLNEGPTTQELEFCRLYIKYQRNGTRAVLEAFPGLSPTQAASKAHNLLSKPQIYAVIYHAVQEAMKRIQVDAEWVLNGAVEVYERCMQKEKILDRNGDFTGEFKFDASNSLKALDIIGKHISVKAFEDRLENDKSREVAERLSRARLRTQHRQALEEIEAENEDQEENQNQEIQLDDVPNFMEPPPEPEFEEVPEPESPRYRELVDHMRSIEEDDGEIVE